MSWALYALLASLLFSSSVLIDKQLLTKQFSKLSETTLTAAAALAGIPFLAVFYFYLPSLPNARTFATGLLAGWLTIGAYQLYYYSLKTAHPAIVAMLFQLVLPFNFLFGVMLFNEKISLLQVVGLTLIVIASIQASYSDVSKKQQNIGTKTFLLMTSASFCIAIASVVFKDAAATNNFTQLAFAEYTSSVVAGLILYVSSKKVRSELALLKKHLVSSSLLLQTNEAANLGGNILLRYATVIGPLALVQGFLSLQPFIVLGLSFILAKLFRYKSNSTRITHKKSLYAYMALAAVGSIAISL
jgi:uncharacterized membrane protein